MSQANIIHKLECGKKKVVGEGGGDAGRQRRRKRRRRRVGRAVRMFVRHTAV